VDEALLLREEEVVVDVDEALADDATRANRPPGVKLQLLLL
jgi:hypothetical protein